MKITKEQKGITLIALVITIIVLLILAGVALATLTGNGSIIDNANYAVTEYNKSAGNDQNVLNQVENLFAKYMGNGNNEQTAAIQEQYGDLVDPSKDAINQDVFTYELTEPSTSRVRTNSNQDGEKGIVSRGDTPSAEPQKGTAKITGINWDYFAGDGFEITDTDSIEAGGSELKRYIFDITNLKKKQQIENIFKKLIIPYEINKNGKAYTVTEVEVREEINYENANWRMSDVEVEENFVPFLSTIGSYVYAGATDENETCVIVPVCVESFVFNFPHDYTLYAEGSPLNN